jgi:hypothetical protein
MLRPADTSALPEMLQNVPAVPPEAPKQEMVKAAEAVRSRSGDTLQRIDVTVLERALREQSGGTMTARLRDVVRCARENWGFPGSEQTAKAILLFSGRYVIEENRADQIVRPR